MIYTTSVWGSFGSLTASQKDPQLGLCELLERPALESKRSCNFRRSTGRGIVLTANLQDSGHLKSCLRIIRQLVDLESNLPVEIFYAGPGEAPTVEATAAIHDAAMPLLRGPPRIRELFTTLSTSMMPSSPCRPNIASIPSHRQPFTLFKPLSAAASAFEQVLFLDINLVLLRQPDSLLDRSDFKSHGLLLFRDYWPNPATDQIPVAAKHFGLPEHGPGSAYSLTWPDAVDSSVVVINKPRLASSLCNQVNFILGGAGAMTSGPYFAGDKDTWLFAATAVNSSAVAVSPVSILLPDIQIFKI